MDSAKIQQLNQFRQICLKNSEDLLKVADMALQQGVDHIAYHLSTLALEEIGKIYLQQMIFVSKLRNEETEKSGQIDDHEKKLFLAFWARTFGQEKITGAQIEKYRSLAKSIHERRLSYLYADPTTLLAGQHKMKAGESKELYNLAKSIFELESCSEGLKTEFNEIESADLSWFLNVTRDPDKRKLIFGNKSQEKLLELGNVLEWIRWNRKMDEENQNEMLETAKREISRQLPESEKERWKPKWRVRSRIISHSYSIRNDAFGEFNKAVEYVKLSKSRPNEIIVDVFLPKAVLIQNLWKVGWDLTRQFVIALNIATGAFFGGI